MHVDAYMNYNLVKTAWRKMDGSGFTGPKQLKMVKIETFPDISKWRDQVFMVFRIGYTNCFFKEFCDDLINHYWLYWTNSGCMAVCLSPNSILYDAESKIHWPWVIQTENERSILRNIWFLDDLAVSIDVGNNKTSMAVSKLFLFKWNIEWSWAYLVKSSNIPTSSVSMFQFSIFIIRWVQFKFHLF